MALGNIELKTALHDELRRARQAVLWKLDGLSEYDVRRPLTGTGTNLRGLIKHLFMGESKYFGEVFGRPFLEHMPWWDEDAENNADIWATASESRSEVTERYLRVCGHSDTTINTLDLDTPGHVPWWPRPNVTLINVIAHVLAETNRHAGHADILREQVDGDADAGRHSMMLTGGRSTSQPSRTRQKRPARPRVRAASADTPSEP